MKKTEILNLFPIETDRLVLRLTTIEDAETIQAAKERRSEALRRWMCWSDERGMSMQGTLDYLNNALSPDNTRNIALLAVDKGSGNFVLATGLDAEDDGFLSFSTGWWVDDGYEGKGLAFEAMTALLEVARNKIGTKTVTAGFYEGNARSQSLMERLGFTCVKKNIKDHCCFLDGSITDSYDYELRWRI